MKNTNLLAPFCPGYPALGRAGGPAIPGSGFFLYFRFYGPLEPYFDKTWKPGDVEPVE